MDFESGEVRKGGTPVSLAGKELQLLRYLIDHRGQAVSREALLETVWEYQAGVSSRTIDVHVTWLRQRNSHGARRRTSQDCGDVLRETLLLVGLGLVLGIATWFGLAHAPSR